MAADEAILDAVGLQIAPPTLRLYRWEKPAVSLGRFQDAAGDLDLAACLALDLEIVRRPTGGRAILHGCDQTVSVIILAAMLGEDGSRVIRSYLRLASGLVEAARILGLELVPSDCERRSGRPVDCFAV